MVSNERPCKEIIASVPSRRRSDASSSMDESGAAAPLQRHHSRQKLYRHLRHDAGRNIRNARCRWGRTDALIAPLVAAAAMVAEGGETGVGR